MNEKIKSVVSKKYNNFTTQIVPVSYFNINLIKNFNEDIIKTKPLEEIGYVKFDVFIYMSDSDGDILKTLKNGDIIPFVCFNMYVPLRFKKMVTDEKNIFLLSYISYDFITLYFQEYVKSMNLFKTPTITDDEKKFLSEKTRELGQYLFVDKKIIDVAKEQIKKIINTDDFKNFNFSTIPNEFDYDNFLEIPNMSDDNDKISIKNSKLDIKNKKQFLDIVKKMFTV